MADSQKYFLDLGGLSTLWQKIKSNFASKEETTSAINNINTTVGGLSTRVTDVENDVQNVNTTLSAITPRVFTTYADAVTYASGLVPGVVVKVTESDGTNLAGFYRVDTNSPVSLIYLGEDTDGITPEQFSELATKVGTLESNTIQHVVVTDGTSQIGTYTVSGNTLYMIHDNVVDVDSNSINALTHRAAAAKFKELANMFSGIEKFNVLPVDELPTSPSLSTIYLLKNTGTEDKNLYTEYLYVKQTDGTYTWEKLGEQRLDLTDYVTMSDVTAAINSALADYATKTEVTAAVQSAKNEINTTLENTYLKKSDAASTYAAKTDVEDIVLTSIQTGNIGETIRITDDQIAEITNS